MMIKNEWRQQRDNVILASSKSDRESLSSGIARETLATIVEPPRIGVDKGPEYCCPEPDAIANGKLVYAVYEPAKSAPTYLLRSAWEMRNEYRVVAADVSDEMLLRNVADGDKAAMHIMFARYRVKVFCLIQRMIGNPAIASDLVGHVFLDGWRSANRIKSEARVFRWLLSIARLENVSELRERTCGDTNQGDVVEIDVRNTPDAAFDCGEADGSLRAYVDKLSPLHGEIINLFYHREKSIAEVSEILRIPYARAKSRLFYARQQLSRALVSAGFTKPWSEQIVRMRAARLTRRESNMSTRASAVQESHNSIIGSRGKHVMKALALSAIMFVFPLLSVHAAPSSAVFNGAWYLTFVTESGACDPTYNFAVNVSNGVVSHPNLVRFRGYVQNSGSVRASVTVQDKYASGSGRLFGSSGRGRWTGGVGNSRCAGYWTAQRN